MSATRTWTGRGEIAREAVRIFKEDSHLYGFEIIKPMGVEFDDEVIYAELIKREDKTSIMLRHRPDAVGFTEQESILLQIKGTSKKPPVEFFDIEVDSWFGAMQWNNTYRHVAFVFVPVNEKNTVLFAWADDLYFRTIKVPMRRCGYRTWEEDKERMERLFPEKTVKTVPHTGGSGTPYFTCHRDSLNDFIDITARQAK